jgi:hypothetical protein
MEKKIRIILAVAALVLLLSGMSSSATLADSGHADYVYVIGESSSDVPLCYPDPSPCTASMAPSGDTLYFSGKGTLSIHAKSVTGGGRYTHHFGADLTVSGTWTAEKLLSFVEYGCEESGLLGTVCGGQALIQVHIVADGNRFEGDGILEIDAPYGDPPSGADEGVRLAVPGALNFNTEVSGPTAFYLLP